tara:strand:- start:129 stop:1619 length:1491 start_codon:yes stop_codon:yes gene_type:complete
MSLGQIKDNRMKNYFYVTFLLITLNWAQESVDLLSSGECPSHYILQLGQCEPDVSVDFDVDGVPDALDNCPRVSNAQQEDSNQNGIGDACSDDYIHLFTLAGTISYWDGSRQGQYALANSVIMFNDFSLTGSQSSSFTDNTGQYEHSIQVSQSSNVNRDITETEVYILPQYGALPSRSPITYRTNIQIPPSARINGLINQDFFVYAPGHIVGNAQLIDMESNLGVHAGTNITINSANIDGSRDRKSTVTDLGGNFDIRNINQNLRNIDAVCCVVGENDDELIISRRYKGAIDPDLKIIPLATVSTEIIMERLFAFWRELLEKSNEAFSISKFESSFKYGKEALDELKNAKLSVAPDIALLTANLGSISFANGRLKDALSNYNEALEILEKNTVKPGVFNILINSNKMIVYEKMDNMELVEETYREIKETLDGIDMKSPDYSLNIIPELIFNIHPSLSEDLENFYNKNSFFDSLNDCGPNQLFLNGDCITLELKTKR